MCLGVLGKVEKIREDNTAVVNVDGVKILADAIYTQVKEGDYVVVHAGIIISKEKREEAEKRMELEKQLEEITRENL